MALTKRYDPGEVEPRLQQFWQASGSYHFDRESSQPIYSIDTPPATVSGLLHLGHVYSYSHPDFMARFWRMRGRNVYYPMGFDDNGLPTERLVEKRLGIRAAEVGRSTFIEKCLQMSEEAEREYQALWQRLGLSIDWRHTYRTIDDLSRRTSQLSFIDLHRRDLVYRSEAPAIWCPECQTAIAQADLNDLERESEYVTLDFRLEDGSTLPIATTRPELLPACVAIFIHPEDARFRNLAGRLAAVPLFGQRVPILADPGADPQKGTGAVMCCTFGDSTDVAWWYKHHLPLVTALDRQGRMAQTAGIYAGQSTDEARRRIKADLEAGKLLLDRQPTVQSIRVHERCDTPVEYIVTRQWFVKVLDFKEELLKAGNHVNWRPDSMQARYQDWVQNLSWDWCISRQRYFGVPFPAWYCQECGETILAEESELPIDPAESQPSRACACGSTHFTPETDVMDTWATSSLTPQIVGRWLEDPQLYERVFPFSLRPQAHEIIRTWAFYTILKSCYHFDALPWKDVLISGWGIAGEGMGKISKSRGGGPVAPMEMIARYSADAVRYWAASTGPGKDAVISEEKIRTGARLVTKLWNVARFSEPFLYGYQKQAEFPELSPADRWILSRLQGLIRRVTVLFETYEYAAAKGEIEAFFWRDLADNYLEMAKQRLYDTGHPWRPAAQYTLHRVLLTLIKLFAPLLPYVTEEIYQGLFTIEIPDTKAMDRTSIHRSAWPEPDPALEDPQAEKLGETLVGIAIAVRRYKSEHNLSLGSELKGLQLTVVSPSDGTLSQGLQAAISDLSSVTRALEVQLVDQLDPALPIILPEGEVRAAVMPAD